MPFNEPVAEQFSQNFILCCCLYSNYGKPTFFPVQNLYVTSKCRDDLRNQTGLNSFFFLHPLTPGFPLHTFPGLFWIVLPLLIFLRSMLVMPRRSAAIWSSDDVVHLALCMVFGDSIFPQDCQRLPGSDPISLVDRQYHAVPCAFARFRSRHE